VKKGRKRGVHRKRRLRRPGMLLHLDGSGHQWFQDQRWYDLIEVVESSAFCCIRKMAVANPLWGAPRIHGELLKLGIEISERTVSRLLPRKRRPPSQSWKTFLDNHTSELVSVETPTLRVIARRPRGTVKVVGMSRVGGMHHRYHWQTAA